MGGFSDFSKREKKKQKKGKEGKSISSDAPIFVLPELVEKKKKNSDQ